MKDQVQKFTSLLEQAQKILITSHISPDPDAITSILLMGSTLRHSYPDRQIRMSNEEGVSDLEFLSGYKEIAIEPLQEALESFRPDLIVMLDAMNFARCTRGDWQKISRDVKQANVKLAIVDHHESNGLEQAEAYINSSYPATAQEVYELLFKRLGLDKPPGYAETTMVGLYSDSGGFLYLTERYRETLKLIGDLIEAGVSVEAIKNRLNQYSEDQVRVIGELGMNFSHQDDYSYSYIGDEFVDNWIREGKELAVMHSARNTFANSYLRNVEERKWGFLVGKDPRLGENYYGITFRSLGGAVDVAAIAAKLEGGGHKAAAGARVQALNIQQAIDRVKQTIKQMR
jgi:phosphoesterase RecJ-like protein